uniref:Uncharacterized protein n=1 Tax=Anguilla anguilla TaxID=7936 RepID=A0A0E9XMS9_ANGAN
MCGHHYQQRIRDNSHVLSHFTSSADHDFLC